MGNRWTQFLSIVYREGSYNAWSRFGIGEQMMCTTANCTLTLAALLKDPLVQLVMRSDNVSETDHSALLFRVQKTLIARASVMKLASQTAL